MAVLLLTACSGAPGATEPSTSRVSTETPPAVARDGETAELVRVLDGDSVIVAIASQEVEVRLLGVNAPEGSECYGDESRDHLQDLLTEGALTVVADGQESDQYGRLLRYLYVNGVNVNREVLTSGHAIVLQSDHSAREDFSAVSDGAARSKLGLWSADACGEQSPPQGIEIVDYVYDPRGPDESNMNEEWVAIANTGENATDLSGWILRDESTLNRFNFPDGLVLPNGDTVVVHSGCGDDSATDVFWCAANPVWSNGGDTLILQLPGGTVVWHERYSGDF